MLPVTVKVPPIDPEPVMVNVVAVRVPLIVAPVAIKLFAHPRLKNQLQAFGIKLSSNIELPTFCAWSLYTYL